MIFTDIVVDEWSGASVGIAANGPSLKPVDKWFCDRWIAVNDTFRIFPFADVVYGADAPWWRANFDSVSAFAPDAEYWCGDPNGDLPETVERIKLELSDKLTLPKDRFDPIISGGFSGYQAIQLAWAKGAHEIHLFGFDCKTISQQARWFGGFDARESEKMSRLGPTWEKRLISLSEALAKQGVKIERHLPNGIH